MAKAKTIKSARHVAAGQARHAKLREELGEAGYREYQKQAHTAAVTRHPGLASRAGKVGYRATVGKYGIEWAKKRLASANEANRTRRLANPTPGEHALCAALGARGYTIHAHMAEPFDYFTWRELSAGLDYGPLDAIREAKIGHYYADILLPVAGVIIEVYGGVHQLNPTRDAQRRQWLEQHGLRVVIISEAEATTPAYLAAILDRQGTSIAGPLPWPVRPGHRRLAA